MATDLSSGMIKVAESKTNLPESKNLTFIQMGFGDFPGTGMEGQFDLVFSDFGGINSIGPGELKKLMDAVHKMLKPEGHFVVVLMPEYCLWEILYFSCKGKWKKAFRRNKKGPVAIDLSGQPVRTWFYSPAKVRKIAEGFSVTTVSPIGIVIPPPFMEPYFLIHKKFLKGLEKVESVLNKIPFLATYSDHFLIDLKKVAHTVK